MFANSKPSFALAGLACWLLFSVTITAQELAAFRLPGPEKNFLFVITPSPHLEFNNPSPSRIDGMKIIQAKRFTTTTTNQPQIVTLIQGGTAISATNQLAKVTLTFSEALLCQADRARNEGINSRNGSAVVNVGELSVSYLASTPILINGRFMPLGDFSAKSFESSAPQYETHIGDEAIKKLKEMGLKPPEDMDPEWKNKGHK